MSRRPGCAPARWASGSLLSGRAQAALRPLAEAEAESAAAKREDGHCAATCSAVSSVLTSVAVIGLLLRVSYEVDRAQRQMARARADAMPVDLAPAPVSEHVQPAPRTLPRGKSARERIEPRIGEPA